MKSGAILLIFYACDVKKEKTGDLDCHSVRKGHFSYRFIGADPVDVWRDDSVQVEKVSDEEELEFRLNWKDSCTYELKFTRMRKKRSESQEEVYRQMLPVECRIILVTLNYYVSESYMGGNKVSRDTLLIKPN